ncbi:GNAT family N-acetyltransferase [Gelatiniphilus marinus]|uniref:GNAT family N-acetyltransferase n=1 Tax=Gelatiniphilus marinus TaxID=1759464 RepID=A0ABW5JP22_9FLAO
MKNSPYLDNPFKTIWLKHFNESKTDVSFSFFNNLTFVKHKNRTVYQNTGKTNTKGISYKLSHPNTEDYKKSVFIVYDVYHFLDTNPPKSDTLGFYKIKQYPGYICDLKNYNGLQDYMAQIISRKSRYKFKSYKKKLEAAHNIHYKMYLDDITPEAYQSLFSDFKRLLKKRFLDKKTVNNNLNPDEWAFYKDLTYPMMLKKQAGLFVVYNNNSPIAITLLNFSGSKMLDVIRVFDIDYSKYRLGSVSIMKQLEWCFKNNFESLDFSKGYFEYKNRWANKPYWFEYHIYYDKQSFKAKLYAKMYKSIFAFKWYLRKHEITHLIHQISFLLNKKKYAE